MAKIKIDAARINRLEAFRCALIAAAEGAGPEQQPTKPPSG
jgi:hypothetical protein